MKEAYFYRIDAEAVGVRIRMLREGQKKSRRDIADFLYVSEMAVCKWEAGKSRPSLDNLYPLSVYLEVTIDELLLGSERNLVA